MNAPSLRILLVFLEPPLPFGNAASRWYYVLFKELVARGHQVKAFAACSKEAEIKKTKEIFPEDTYDIELDLFPERKGVKSKIQSVLSPSSYHFSDRLKKKIELEAQKGFDIMHVEQLWTSWATIPYSSKCLINVHHLLSIDLEHNSPDSPKEKFLQGRNLQTESRLIKKYNFFRSCSPRLVEKIKSWNPQAEVSTIPVGIDHSLYSYIPDESRKDQKIISLIGNMSWFPGQSAAFRLLDRLWPQIIKQVPDARLQIVGWSAKSVLKDYIGCTNIEIYENVPDIQPYFENTNVMLYAPARGSGMKIKILEAMGFGIPVVTTSEGSEGLPAVDGVHMGLCEDDEGLIERTVNLLTSIDQQNKVRKEARKLLENHCSPQNTVDQVVDFYRKMMTHK